jgi:hypothetical protein
MGNCQDDFSLNFKDYSQLSFIDCKTDFIELLLDEKSVGSLEVSTDHENNAREYIIINYEIIYLDTIKKISSWEA